MCIRDRDYTAAIGILVINPYRPDKGFHVPLKFHLGKSKNQAVATEFNKPDHPNPAEDSLMRIILLSILLLVAFSAFAATPLTFEEVDTDGDGLVSADEAASVEGLDFNAADGDNDGTLSVDAVSYTHLDVYKRQVGGCASTVPRFPPGAARSTCNPLAALFPSRHSDSRNRCLLYTSRCV